MVYWMCILYRKLWGLHIRIPKNIGTHATKWDCIWTIIEIHGISALKNGYSLDFTWRSWKCTNTILLTWKMQFHLEQTLNEYWATQQPFRINNVVFFLPCKNLGVHLSTLDLGIDAQIADCTGLVSYIGIHTNHDCEPICETYVCNCSFGYS